MLAGVSKGRVMKTKTHNLMLIIIKEKQNYFGWSETAHIQCTTPARVMSGQSSSWGEEEDSKQ